MDMHTIMIVNLTYGYTYDCDNGDCTRLYCTVSVMNSTEVVRCNQAIGYLTEDLAAPQFSQDISDQFRTAELRRC